MDNYEYRIDDVTMQNSRSCCDDAMTYNNKSRSDDGMDCKNKSRNDDRMTYNNNSRSDDGMAYNNRSRNDDGMTYNNRSRSNSRGNHVYYESCEEHKTHDLGDTEMISTGRLLDVTLTLRNVCPRRRVALGVTVNEVDDDGNEAARGFKAVTVPAHTQASACDVTAPTLRFVLPEDLNENSQNGGLGRRHFIVRATTHYVDSQANLC